MSWLGGRPGPGGSPSLAPRTGRSASRPVPLAACQLPGTPVGDAGAPPDTVTHPGGPGTTGKGVGPGVPRNPAQDVRPGGAEREGAVQMHPCRRVGGGPRCRGPGQKELCHRLRLSVGAQSGSWARVKRHRTAPALGGTQGSPPPCWRGRTSLPPTGDGGGGVAERAPRVRATLRQASPALLPPAGRWGLPVTSGNNCALFISAAPPSTGRPGCHYDQLTSKINVSLARI